MQKPRHSGHSWQSHNCCPYVAPQSNHQPGFSFSASLLEPRKQEPRKTCLCATRLLGSAPREPAEHHVPVKASHGQREYPQQSAQQRIERKAHAQAEVKITTATRNAKTWMTVHITLRLTDTTVPAKQVCTTGQRSTQFSRKVGHVGGLSVDSPSGTFCRRP